MKKQTNVQWVANDGTVFNNYHACKKYEMEQKTLYKVTTRVVMEWSENVWADSEKEAIDFVENNAPYVEDWHEVDDHTIVTILKSSNKKQEA